ncbi:12071_t:CDS:2, partial [Cetraspora pellucida]
GTAYNSLIVGNIIPFIKLLKTTLLARSRMSLFSANEAVLQAIVEILLPSRHRVPELCLVIDGKKRKGSGCFSFLDIFVLGGIERNDVCLELKYISLNGLARDVGNQVGVLAKSHAVGYSTLGVFDERIKIIKSGPNKLEGFIIMVVGFRRILWRPIEEMISNYKYINV